MYKNKILGVRGRAEGLIFSNFEYRNNVITQQEAAAKEYIHFSCGVDTSYSAQSEDTISFIFQGITRDGELIVLEEEVKNNKDEKIPFSPSDIALNLFQFLERCRKKMGISQNSLCGQRRSGNFDRNSKAKEKEPKRLHIHWIRQENEDC